MGQTINTSTIVSSTLEQQDVKQHAKSFLRTITSGRSPIRIVQNQIIMPANIDWNTLKLVSKDFIQRYREEVIAPYEVIAMEAWFRYPIATLDEKMYALIEFFVRIEYPQKKEKPLQEMQTKAQKKIRQTIAVPQFTDIFGCLPRLNLPINLVEGPLWLEIITVAQKQDTQHERNLMKDMLLFFASQYKKDVSTLKRSDAITLKTIEFLLVYVKLHLKKNIFVRSSLLYKQDGYATVLRDMLQAGIIQPLPKEVATPITTTPVRPPKKVISKLSPSFDHGRVFDCNLLVEKGYDSPRKVYHAIEEALKIDDSKTVFDIAWLLISMSDNDYHALQADHGFAFRVLKKLFEDVIFEIEPQYSRKRWFIKGTK